MAVVAPWGALVRRGGTAAVGVVLFRVFCGAAKAACRRGRRNWSYATSAAVALDDCSFLGQEAGSGSHAKEPQLEGERGH
jgi:hypothetical protein